MSTSIEHMQIGVEVPTIYEGQDPEDNLSWPSDDEIMNDLDYLDSIDDMDSVNDRTFFVTSRRPNAHGGNFSRPESTLQPLSNRMQKFSNRICTLPRVECEENLNFCMSNSVTTKTRQIFAQTAIGKTRNRDKADRATTDHAMDPITRMKLSKMISKNEIEIIDGIIATGKEANVYYAKNDEDRELAVKVYKTSVLSFKNRNRYIVGDRRFTNGYSGSNPRKMVAMWAEKECRNLERLRKGGILCPAPVLLERNILVMDFIGKDGREAPRLKDADLSEKKLSEGYLEIIKAMKTLYKKCGLVHGDLSEYNILYFEGHMYIIDVSQSVLINHPHSDEFLREDCVHITNYFGKHGVRVMDVEKLMVYIKSSNNDTIEEFLASDAVEVQQVEEEEVVVARQEQLVARMEDLMTDLLQLAVEKTLELVDTTEEVHKHQIINSNEDLNNLPIDQVEEEEEVTNPNSDYYTCESDGFLDDDANKTKTRAKKKIARKENKKMVKEEKKEARKTKIPKADKKRRKKLSKAPRTR